MKNKYVSLILSTALFSSMLTRGQEIPIEHLSMLLNKNKQQ